MSRFPTGHDGPSWDPEAMTTRGCTTADFQKIADFLDRCCKIALKAWDHPMGSCLGRDQQWWSWEKLKYLKILTNGLWILESKPPSFEFGSHLALTHAQTVVFPSQLQLENIQWPIATHLFELKSVTIIALSNMATDVWSADLFKGNLGRGYLALFESPRIRVNSRDEIYQYISEFTYKVEVKNIHQG